MIYSEKDTTENIKVFNKMIRRETGTYWIERLIQQAISDDITPTERDIVLKFLKAHRGAIREDKL